MREPLTRQAIVAAATEVADEAGVAGLSMRRIAQRLGVEAMSLYHHFPNKDALLDALVDALFARIDFAETPGDWQASLRAREHAVRSVLNAHPWAVPLMESRRTPGPATLAHHDRVLGILADAGFSLPLTAHAYALLDAYTYGFVVQEQTLPLDDATSAGELAAAMLTPEVQQAYPHLTRFAQDHVLADPDYDFSAEFEVGLELILEALAARHAREAA